MPIGAATSTHSDPWVPRDRDVKDYFHFDRRLSPKKLADIANNPDAVAKNRFYPLLRFEESWTKFRKRGQRKSKTRPLRYSARRDAAIYARYRHLLSERYEIALSYLGISDAPIAYRRIPNPSSGGNKCNIEFARDVFSKILEIGDCLVTVVDVKSYFESLDHDRIRLGWERLWGAKLPADHEAVFRSLTNYAFVERDAVFSRLGMHEKVVGSNRKANRRRKLDDLAINGHRQICSPADFRALVCGGAPNLPSLIQRNTLPFGIPQGTPISDLIANFYLLDFDKFFYDFCLSRGGMYRRYSDDIICIIPKSAGMADTEMKNMLQKEIRKYGPKIEIQDRKVTVSGFSRSLSGIDFTHIHGETVRNGLEYLGFEFNGRIVKIKNATLSNAWRKLKRYSYGHARRFVREFRGKGEPWLRANYDVSGVEMRMIRDVTFNQDNGYETWTFIKYARRASRAFVGLNPIFAQQTKRYRYRAQVVILEGLEKAIRRHGAV